MPDYETFLASKRVLSPIFGKDVKEQCLHPMLFPFQRRLTSWGIRKGRAALFADTGLGKTFMGAEWARSITSKHRIVVAPLSVVPQTIGECKKIGIDFRYSENGEVYPFTITNYERIGNVDPNAFDAVVLDESSILKSLDGKTRDRLIEMFANTPYRLCCTATPAPNDIVEIANHAEFLGIMSRRDMLATFFVHDEDGWRLKGHAEEAFYRWLASWGMFLRFPSDLGFDDTGYILPPLNIEPLVVRTALPAPKGRLLWSGKLKNGLIGRSYVRKGTLTERCRALADVVNKSKEQWIVWCGLNEESRQAVELIDGAVEITGGQPLATKIQLLKEFLAGKIRVICTKVKILGFGTNAQVAHNMAFLGLNDSWEGYYQCIRREWRFGQKYPVWVLVVISEPERSVYENVLKKERQAQEMSKKLLQNVREFERAEIANVQQKFEYRQQRTAGKGWELQLGDSAEVMKSIGDDYADLSVFSPPFLSLYTYSATERDLGNSRSKEEFFQHFDYVIKELLRITKLGRNAAVHVSQVPATLINDGWIGMKDLRGDTIRAFETAGWDYSGEVCIDKDPQVQAIRTHAKGLLFVQKTRDSTWLRPGMADYILLFRKPGENAVPVISDITNNQWIEWAHPVWYNIKETNTLNAKLGRDNLDERHICPLQLETIERCIRLWTNRGELVFSPFAGIGSEGYMSLLLGRTFHGI